MELQTSRAPIETKKQSDKVINYFLGCMYIVGLLLSFFYDTWLIGFGVGTLSLLAYYSVKYFLPNSNLYQYVLSVVFGLFMAQYIYQMHGLFEMHFMAFVGSTILITYKNWKLQIPLAMVVAIHHSLFNYLQYIGFSEIYFTQLAYLDIQTLIIHGILANIIFGICGLWAYQFKKYSSQIEQSNKDLAIKRKELLESNTELERSNYDLMQFASIASHDLKEPLRKIQSYSDLVLTRNADKFDEKTAKHFSYIMDSSGRMKMLIEDILKYSKIGSASLEFKKVNLNEIVNTIINDLEILIEEKKARINVSKLCEIECVPGQIRQVFQNLISNALKFNKNNEQTIIKISSATSPGKDFGINDDSPYCKITVTDNGIGFDMKHSEQIFTLFNRLHAKDKFEGTGIGLAIVKKIVERHKGMIAVESEPGRGTTFSVLIPAIQKEDINILTYNDAINQSYNN